MCLRPSEAVSEVRCGEYSRPVLPVRTRVISVCVEGFVPERDSGLPLLRVELRALADRYDDAACCWRCNPVSFSLLVLLGEPFADDLRVLPEADGPFLDSHTVPDDDSPEPIAGLEHVRVRSSEMARGQRVPGQHRFRLTGDLLKEFHGKTATCDRVYGHAAYAISGCRIVLLNQCTGDRLLQPTPDEILHRVHECEM